MVNSALSESGLWLPPLPLSAWPARWSSYPVAGYLETGTLRGALFSAISAGAASAIGGYFADLGSFGHEVGRALAHGLTQGAIAAAQGGKFAAGALSAAFSSGFGSVNAKYGLKGTDTGSRIARVATAAVIGGTASKIGGGKFANGAATAAFVQGFNDERHQSKATEDGKNGEEKSLGQSISEAAGKGWHGLKETMHSLAAHVGDLFDAVKGVFRQESGAIAETASRVGGAVIGTGIEALDVDVARGAVELSMKVNLDRCIDSSLCYTPEDNVAISGFVRQSPPDYVGAVRHLQSRGWEYRSYGQLLTEH